MEDGLLRVATLNLAHGRGDRLNQALLSDATVRSNLEAVAEALRAVDAQVVALQEADAPSSWSGDFDHVQALVEQAAYPYAHHAVHAQNRFYAFGTALLARVPLLEPHTHHFPPSRPTTTKGFVAARVAWNPGAQFDRPVPVLLVSVHLDFSRRSVRLSQVDELSAYLEGQCGPKVVMGDFNSDWLAEESSLRILAERLDLVAYEPLAEGHATYPSGDRRLDWILASRDLVIEHHRVVAEVISDHRMVVADLRLADAAAPMAGAAPVDPETGTPVTDLPAER